MDEIWNNETLALTFKSFDDKRRIPGQNANMNLLVSQPDF
jgi:hypothetical protein